MELWAWLVAYLIGFVLLGLYLYQYFSNRTTDSERTPTSASGRGIPSETASNRSRGLVTRGPTDEMAIDSTEPANLAPPEGISHAEALECPACGAYNRSDRMFRFCRNCGERLG